MTSPFTELERDLWRPPQKITVSQWADRYRRLPSTDPKPGPWRTSFTPYWRGVMDAFNDPRVEEIVIEAGAQVGKSRILENIAGFVACEDPVDMLMVVARDSDVRTLLRSRLKPLIDDCPALSRQLTDSAQDVNREQVQFRRCALFLAASNSSAGLASKSCGVVLLDEIGKWPAEIKHEGSPIDLARQRTNAFAGRRKIVAVSSATTEKHGIHPEYLRTDQRRFYVPCHACGHFQHLRWEQVKFEGRDPDRILADDLAWYECERCAERWSDAEKRQAMASGVWCPEDGEVLEDGSVIGRLDAAAQGFHVPGLLSPLRTFADFAARWLRAQKNRRKLAVFFRSDLGLPWQEVETEREAEDVEAARGDHLLGEVPAGAEILCAGIDVGKHVVHWVVRGFARGLESWLVQRGVAATPQEAVAAVRAVQGTDPVRIACIDSGWNTSRIYELCANWKGFLRPVKGKDRREPGRPILPTAIDQTPSGKHLPGGLKLWSIDTGFFKDLLEQHQAEGTWHLPMDIDSAFCEQIAAEHKVIDEDGFEKWELRSEGLPNHFLDAEVYSMVAAYMLGLWKMRAGSAPRADVPRPATTPTQPAADLGMQPAGRGRARGGGRRRGGGWGSFR